MTTSHCDQFSAVDSPVCDQPLIKSVHCCQISLGYLEAVDITILEEALFLHAFWQCHHVVLKRISEMVSLRHTASAAEFHLPHQELCRRARVGLCQGYKLGVLHSHGSRQGRIRLHNDVVLGTHLPYVSLGVEGMDFNLIHHRLNLGTRGHKFLYLLTQHHQVSNMSASGFIGFLLPLAPGLRTLTCLAP